MTSNKLNELVTREKKCLKQLPTLFLTKISGLIQDFSLFSSTNSRRTTKTAVFTALKWNHTVCFPAIVLIIESLVTTIHFPTFFTENYQLTNVTMSNTLFIHSPLSVLSPAYDVSPTDRSPSSLFMLS